MRTACAWKAESLRGPEVTGRDEEGNLEKVALEFQPFGINPEHKHECEKSQIQSSEFPIRSLNSGKFLNTHTHPGEITN